MADTTKAEIIKHPAEQVGNTVKKTAWGAVIESLVVMVLGILMVVWPNTTVAVVTNVLGAFLIINGIYQIVMYFVAKGQNDFFNDGLLTGVISLLVGIAAIVIGEDITNVFRIVIGIWMIYESLVRVNTAIKLHSVEVQSWKYMLILAIVMLALGIFVTFNAGAVTQLIGWMLILSGIIGIIGDVMFIQQVNTVVEKLTKK